MINPYLPPEPNPSALKPKKIQDDNVLRLFMGEVLTESLDKLSYLISKYYQNDINVLAVCGETPAHVAIYKNNSLMLQILLKAGAEPNVKNREGNSLVHVAVQLGYYHLLKLLYDTEKCDLTLTNSDELSPIQIAQETVTSDDLISANLFKEWNSGVPHNNIIQEISEGRKLCYEFLTEKLKIDADKYLSKLHNDVKVNTIKRQILRRMFHSSPDTQTLTILSNIEYPITFGENHYQPNDEEFYSHYRIGVNEVATKVFVEEHVDNAIKLALHTNISHPSS